jgi:dTDP-4-dehydrorhamnose reductase
MKILIFGSNGLLGSYISGYLSLFHSIIKINRNIFDIYNLYKNGSLISELKILIELHQPDYIVNCAGIINKRDDISIQEMYIVNSYFPIILSKISNNMSDKIKIIHPSTDCVFSGKEGNYTKTDITDAYDNYGISKILAEEGLIKFKNTCIIRCSIIGEEKNGGSSLIKWINNNNNKTINGYTNHIWNGITTLEYAKVIKEIINNKIVWWNGVKHIGCKEPITKCNLVKEIIKTYNLNIEVREIETEKNCYRNLNLDENDDIIRSDIKKQLTELLSYYFY